LTSITLQIFKDKLFPSIKDSLYKAILNQITRDRNKEIIDIGSLKIAISTFLILCYTKPVI